MILIMVILLTLWGDKHEQRVGGIVDVEATGSALAITSRTYFGIRMKQLHSHPAWWMLTLQQLHAIMLPIYISNIIWNVTKRTIIPIAITIMTLLMPLIKLIAYISGWTLGLIGELYYELLYLLFRWKFYKPESKAVPQEVILQFGPYHHFTQPLPCRYMVLSGARLFQAFVGWWYKIVGRQLKFADKLHHFGLHKLLLVSMLSLQSIESTTAIAITMKKTAKEQLKTFTSLEISNNTLLLEAKSILQETNFGLEGDPFQNLNHFQHKLQKKIPLCLPCEAFDYTKPLALANEDENSGNSDETLKFDDGGVEFGADNCATHHICADKTLFVGDVTLLDGVGVRGINGTSMAKEIGTIKFEMKDDDGKSHTITLENVLYLPEASKNLISISQWSEQKKDNCGIMSRGEYSLFSGTTTSIPR